MDYLQNGNFYLSIKTASYWVDYEEWMLRTGSHYMLNVSFQKKSSLLSSELSNVNIERSCTDFAFVVDMIIIMGDMKREYVI